MAKSNEPSEEGLFFFFFILFLSLPDAAYNCLFFLCNRSMADAFLRLIGHKSSCHCRCRKREFHLPEQLKLQKSHLSNGIPCDFNLTYFCGR